LMKMLECSGGPRCIYHWVLQVGDTDLIIEVDHQTTNPDRIKIRINEQTVKKCHGSLAGTFPHEIKVLDRTLLFSYEPAQAYQFTLSVDGLPFEFLLLETRNDVISISHSLESYLDPQSARNMDKLSARTPSEEIKSERNEEDGDLEAGLLRLIEVNVSTLDEFKAVVAPLMPKGGQPIRSLEVYIGSLTVA